MNIITALLPAIGWGVIPLIVSKVKNSQPTNKILGVGIVATIVGIIVTISQRPAMSLPIFLLSILSGAFWALSKTMPISTGLQLIGNTIIGALIFGKWSNINEYVLGSLALILIIIGVVLTTVTRKKNSQKLASKDLLFLLFTTIGLLGFTQHFLRLFQPAHNLYSCHK